MTTKAELENFVSLEISRVATVLLSTGSDPFSMSGLRWGLARLGEIAARDPLGAARELVGAMLTIYDHDFAPRVVRGTPMLFCFGACSPPEHGCSGDIDGMPITHVAGGAWVAEGRVFPADRVQAERYARTCGVLRRLAAELGVDPKGSRSESVA